MKTLLKGLSITHISSCLPKEFFSFENLKDLYGEKEVDKIIKTTGIQGVHLVSESTTASDLCYEAARVILEDLDTSDDIDGLIFVSQTRDHLLPQTSHILQGRLGLSKETYCLDMPLGCSGYIYGLMQASLLISSGTCEKILVLAGDTTSKIVNDLDRASRMVFGDAGTATLIQKGENDMFFTLKADGYSKDSLIVPAGGFRHPKDPTTGITYQAEEGSSRSNEDLFMDGMAVFNFVISQVPKMLKNILNEVNWDNNNLDVMILHQANTFMVEYVRRKMKLTKEKVPSAVETYGNTGPASIPLALSTLYANSTSSLEKVILAGFGVGLSWGACNCNLKNTSIFEPKVLNY